MRRKAAIIAAMMRVILSRDKSLRCRSGPSAVVQVPELCVSGVEFRPKGPRTQIIGL